MKKSESIANLAAAFCKFQSVLAGVKKTANNPFYRSKYADLASIWEAIREPLTENGLSVTQLGADEDASENCIRIETILMHESGEYISGVTEIELVLALRDNVMVRKNDPQAVGSAITYARRYGLSAILGIHQEDDDGNSFTESPKYKKQLADAEAEEKAKTKTAASVPTTTELQSVKVQCSNAMKVLVEAEIDGYHIPTRRENSCLQHIGTRKISECTDINALRAYLAHLQEQASVKPSKRVEAAKLIANAPITGEEREMFNDLLSDASDDDQIDAIVAKVKAAGEMGESR